MKILKAIFGLAGLLCCHAALAQSYPSRTITLLTPFPLGASTDAVARLLRDGLSQKLNQIVIVENRGGAGGKRAARLERPLSRSQTRTVIRFWSR